MSITDNRIINMVFENRQFEKNIAQSKKSVEDFKEAMDFDETSRGLEKFADAANHTMFSNMEANLQRLADKFTGIGDAGEYMVSRIRAALEGAARSVESFVKSISIDQISVGQSKYDALNKAVMTIISTGKYAEDEAYSVFNRLMTYTNETSYSFQDMVNQIASFTSTGQNLAASEEAMEGIANLSAKAGQGVTQASIAMGTFSKALGAGYLDLQKWQSLNLSSHIITEEFRQTLMDTAVEMGDLVKEGDKYYTATKYGKKELVEVNSLENTLNKRWATSNTLMATLRKYYFEGIDDPTADWDTFAGSAAKAAQRALNLTDAINAMKEAVSAGWMETFRIFWGDLSESMETFTGIANRTIEVLDRISEWRNGVLRQWRANGGAEDIISILLGDYTRDAKTGAVGIVDILETAGDTVINAIWDFLRIFAAPDERADVVWNNEGFKEEWLGRKLAEITHGVQEFMKSIRDFFTEEINVGGETKTRLDLIHDTIVGVLSILQLASAAIFGLIGFFIQIGQQLQPSFDAIGGFFAKLGRALFGTAMEVEDSKAIPLFFEELSETLRPLTEGINEVVIAFADMLGILIETDQEEGGTKSFFHTLGDVLKTVAKIITTVGKPIMKFLGGIVEIIQDLFTNGFTKETLGKAAQKFAESFGTLLKELFGSLPESLGFLKNWIYDLFGLWEDESEGDSKSFFSFLHKIFDIGFGEIGQFLQKLATGGYSLFDFVKDGLGITSAWNFINTIAGLFKGTNLYGLIMAFLGVVSLWKFYKLIKNANDIVDSISEFGGNLVNSIKHGFAVRFEDYGEYVLKMAEGIAILIGCVLVLGNMPIAVLAKGVITLGIVMGMLYLFDTIMKKKGKKEKLGDSIGYASKLVSLGLAVAAIAAAVAILALALIPLSKDPTHMLTAILGLGLILGELALFATILKENNLSSTKLKGAIGLAAAVAILAITLIPLSNMPIKNLAKGLLGIGVILAMLVAFAYALDTMKVKTTKITGVIGLAAGIGVLVIAMQPLANMSIGQLLQSLAGVAVIMGLLATFAWILNKMNVSSVKLAGLTGLAVGIGVLILAMQPIAYMSDTQLQRGLKGLIGVMGSILLFVGLLKVAKISNVQLAGLFGLVASIALLMLALIPIGNMDPKALGQAIFAMAIVMVELNLFLVMLKLIKVDNVKIAGLFAVIISVVALMLALIPLGNMSIDQISNSLIAMTGVMILLGVFLAGMKVLKPSIQGAVSVLLMLVGLAAVIFTFSFALNEVKNIDSDKIMSFAIGLSLLIGAIALSSAILGALGASSFIGVAALAVALAAVIGVLALMLPILMGSVGNSLTELSSRLLLVSSMISEFSNSFNSVDEGGIDKASLLIGKLKDLMANLSGFSGYDGDIAAFTTALYDVGTTLGYFATDTANVSDPESSNALKMLDALIGMKDKFTGFDIGNVPVSVTRLGSGLRLFTNMTSDIESGENPALALLTQFAGMATDLNTISTLNLNNLKGNIAGLGGAMSLYAMGAKEMTGLEVGETPDVTAAVALLKAISESLTGENAFEIPTDFPDETQLSSFGADLAALAMALQKFANASTDLGESGQYAINTLAFLQDLKGFLTEDNIKATTALGAAGVDATSLAAFGVDITALGAGLKDFATSCVGFPDTKPALDTLAFLATLKDKLGAQEFSLEFVNRFLGFGLKEEQLTDFGKQIRQLGTSMRSFAESTSRVNEKTGEVEPIDYTNAVNALSTLVELKGKLPDMGGLLDIIIGRKQTLNDVAAELEGLSIALMDVSDRLNGGGEEGGTKFDPAAVEAAITSTNSIVTLMARMSKELPRVGGVASFFETLFVGRVTNLEDVAKDIESFGKGLKQLADGFKSFTETDEEDPVDSALVEEVLGYVDTVYTWLGKLSLKLPKLGGAANLWSTLWGGRSYNLNDIGTEIGSFGTGLQALGGGFKAFQTEEGGEIIDEGTVETSLKSVDTVYTWFARLVNRLPKIGGFANMWDTLWGGRSYNLTDIGTEIGDLGTGLQSFGGALQYFEPGEGEEGLTDARATAAVSVVDSAISFLERLNDSQIRLGGVAQFFKTLWEGRGITLEEVGVHLEGLGDSLATFGGKISGHFTNTEEINNAMTVYSTMASVIGTLGTVASELSTTGKFDLSDYYAIADTLIQFIDVLVSDVTVGSSGSRKTVSIIDSIVDTMVSISTKMKQAGNIDKDSIGIFKMMAEALNSFSNINISNDFAVIGESIAAGVVQGINTGTSSVVTAAENMAWAAYIAAKAKLGIESPSKVFSDIGEFVDLGFAKGINKSSNIVTNAMDSMVYEGVMTEKDFLDRFQARLARDTEAFAKGVKIDAIQSMKDTVIDSLYLLYSKTASKLGRSVEEVAHATEEQLRLWFEEAANKDAQPTITPVLDMSDVESGLRTFDKDLGKGTYLDTSFASNIAGNIAAGSSNSDSNQNGIDMSGVYDRMSQMTQQIAQLGTSIKNMKLVLDSGVIAGAVTDGVDANVGRKMFYAGRRN